MDPQVFAKLAAKAQAGNRKALSALLLLAHTPVSFQCRALLRDDAAAEELTRQILAAIPRTLPTLADPDGFELWICRVTASRCMLALEQLPPEEAEPLPAPEPPFQDMDETQTALLVRELVDRLPEKPRVCLLLYCCAGLKLKGISQLTGCPEGDVLRHLNMAQETINQQLRSYHKMGVHFTPIPALSTLLRTAMYAEQDPQAAAELVRDILPARDASPRSVPAVSKPLLLAVIAAGALLLMLLAVILVLET